MTEDHCVKVGATNDWGDTVNCPSATELPLSVKSLQIDKLNPAQRLVLGLMCTVSSCIQY